VKKGPLGTFSFDQASKPLLCGAARRNGLLLKQKSGCGAPETIAVARPVDRRRQRFDNG
jgi:hypothetical protein